MAHHQLAEGQDEVRLQCQRVVLVGVVLVDVHGVHVLGTGGADADHLALQPLHQRRVFCLRVADDDVIVRHQEGVGDLPLRAEGLAGAGGAEDQAVRVLQLLPVHHDEVAGKGVQAVVEGLLPPLEELLGGEGHEDRGAAGGEGPADVDQVVREGEAAHEGVLLLVVEAAEQAVVLLGDG